MDEHDQIMTFDGALSFRRNFSCITSSTLFAAAAAAHRWLQHDSGVVTNTRQPQSAKKRRGLFEYLQALSRVSFLHLSSGTGFVCNNERHRAGLASGVFGVCAERERLFALDPFSFSLSPSCYPLLFPCTQW